VHLFLVGAGPVGLVTAVGFARLGHVVTVADIDAGRIADLGAGRPPLFEPGLEEAIEVQMAARRLEFTTTLTPPAGARFSIVCVGTPGAPGGTLSVEHVSRAVATILEVAPADHVIVVRSTLPLDGPDHLAALVARREDETGTGNSATVVTNPEFMREGAGLADFDRPSRIMAGWLRPADRPAAEAVAALYAPLGAPTLVADARSVALVKLASNVFLGVKIGFANELARICEVIGADVETVARGIGMDDRIGRAFLGAGPGFGGSCLPEQAVALAYHARALEVPTPLIDAASRSNDTHQAAIVARIAASLGCDHTARTGARLDGVCVAVLGLAFKAGTDDVRTSPALAIVRLLRDAGARVVGHDPRARATALRADPALVTAEDVVSAAESADVVVVATEWPEYTHLDWHLVAVAMRGNLVYDTRRIVDRAAVESAGLRLVSLGRAADEPAGPYGAGPRVGEGSRLDGAGDSSAPDVGSPDAPAPAPSEGALDPGGWLGAIPPA
jgi:UDPglucose 6-dehydrogenase